MRIEGIGPHPIAKNIMYKRVPPSTTGVRIACAVIITDGRERNIDVNAFLLPVKGYDG